MIKNILRPPHYVPESKKAFDLLTELQSKGCVWPWWWMNTAPWWAWSVEDLLEELCGEIPQEFTVEEKPLRLKWPLDRWRVKASLPWMTWRRSWKSPFPPGEYDTVGGFILHLFGSCLGKKTPLPMISGSSRC
jgi:CBS domain containing-hemolysin-like protein